MYRIGIIGGGAAGMMAAAAAKETSPVSEVILFEKNEKPGKKLYITGKGRCNVTNTCGTQESLTQIVRNPKFLYSALYGFDHDAVMEFFASAGVPLKTERGGRVFPVSDHASDITRALVKRLTAAGVEIRLNTAVRQILIQAGPAQADRTLLTGLKTADGKEEHLDAVIVATGGLSYPATGSTGDGYRFARETGHRVEAQRPSLVAMETVQDWCRDLTGLTLHNVNVSLYAGGKCIAQEFGELLFTHFGVSGPVILRLSAVPSQKQIDAGLSLEMDLKSALSEEMLDRRLLRDLEKYRNRDMRNALKDLLPQALIPVILRECDIDPRQKANALSAVQRAALRQNLKHLHVEIAALRGFHEAVITRGGVSVKDINASTMESKRVSGLYFAGEVIDVDALTGGYNLQIAWSTGHLAGKCAAERAGG